MENKMDRKKFIGGTDAAAILGLSKWRTPFQVWLEKTGRAEPREENPSMEWGKRLESAIAKKWADAHGVAMLDKGHFIIHKEYPFIGGTPDNFIPSPSGGLEVKTARFSAEWGDGPDEIPVDYWMQCQWYAGLMMYDEWHLAALIGGSEYHDYVIPFSAETYALALEACVKFWMDHVETDTPPQMDGSNDAGKYLAKKFPKKSDEIDLATKAQEELIAARKKLAEKIDENNALLAEIDNQLKEAIGERKGLVCEAGKAVWVRAAAGTTTDWRSVAETFKPSDELVKKFSKTKAGSNYLKFS